MSVKLTEPKHFYPVTTTTTNSAAVTTTTTTVNSERAATTSPSLAPRPPGWHAQATGFNWNKNLDQRRYRLHNDLPEIHAAVINHDWETALESLCAEDIGLLWLPVTSQHYTAKDGKDTETSGWALHLASKNKPNQLNAIRQMAIVLASKTTVTGYGCLYGANLLTLCLQISTPPEFMQHLLTMIREHAPQYLDLPDASGRTPLYIAVDRQDEAQVRMLLDAGATPFAPLNFATREQRSHMEKTGKNNHVDALTNAFDHALISADQKIFSLLVENSLKSSNWRDGYPTSDDPLKLTRWASLHAEDELRALASQFNILKSFLFNQNDKSGTSIVSRALAAKAPLDEDVVPFFMNDPELGIIYAAAIYDDIETLIQRLNTWLENTSNTCENQPALQAIYEFFKVCNWTNVHRIIQQCPKLEPFIRKITKEPDALLSLPFKTFCGLILSFWSSIDSEDRNVLTCKSAKYDSRYIKFITGLPGFNLPPFPFIIDAIYWQGVNYGNAAAFELAAPHQRHLSEIIKEIKSAAQSNELADINVLHVISVLRAGSLLWFEKFIKAGLDLQPLLDSDGATILPLMADLNPERLSDWLTGINFDINEEIINDSRTEKGRDALLNLIKAEKNMPQKATIEKANS